MDRKSGLTITGKKEADADIGLLKVRALVLQLAKSTTGELATGEIVTEYLNSVKDDYQIDDSVDFTGQVIKDQSKFLHDRILFLKHLLLTLSHRHLMQLDSSCEEKVSAIRVSYEAFLGRIGSVIYSHFNNPVKWRTSYGLSELIEEVEFIQEEAFEAIFSITVGRMGGYLIESKADLLIVFLENYKEFMDRKSGLMITKQKESDGDIGFLKVKALVLLLAKSSTGELAPGEIVTEYLNSVKDYQIDDSLDTAGQVLKDQSKVLHDGILFLKHLLLTLSHRHGSWEGKISSIRVRYEAFLGMIGSVIYTYFNNPMKGSTSSLLSELIERVEFIQEEAIEAIFSIILGRMGEYLIGSEADLLLVFLENYKEFIDRKSGLMITEQKETDTADIGLLKVRALSLQLAKSTTGELATDEIVKQYVNSVKDYQLEDFVDPKGQLLKDDSKVLHHRIMFLNLVLISHGHDHPMQLPGSEEKLSAVRVHCNDFLGNIGTCIHSYFCNQRNGRISSVLLHLIGKVDLIQEEIRDIISPKVFNSIGQESPRTDQLGFLNLLLDKYWNELMMDCKSDTIIFLKDQFQTIHRNLCDFRSIIQKTSIDDHDTHNLLKRVTEAGYAAEYLLNSFAARACPVWCTSLWISELMEHCKKIDRDISINDVKVKDKDPRNDTDLTRGHSRVLFPTADDVMVGFQDEKNRIMGCLLAIHVKQLDVVSIIGMAGLGKTTLAKKVYEDPATVSHFDVRAWCCVSQEYNQKDLLLTILSFILVELTDEIRRKSENALSLMVHQQLTGRRYLIVVDDVWGIEAFWYLKRFFPKNGNGSRIVLTSRNIEIGLGAKCHSNPIELGFLTTEESLNLLERRIYGEGRCPPELRQVGNKIAEKCRGLPLAIVVVAGFLARSEKKEAFWEQVVENFSSYLADDEKVWTAALDLSYKYLPDSLKPLFLYLGAFPEDKEIHVDKLIWLWVAEGLVHKNGSGSSEDQAETCLTDLIGRSLVMVAKRKSDGRVKSCHVHDLLRDMCLAKAREENFMHQVHAYDLLTDPIIYQRRLSIFLTRSNVNDATSSSSPLITYDYLPSVSITPPLRTFLFFNNNNKILPQRKKATESVFSMLKLLRVLHSESTTIDDDVYKNLTGLVYLRYMSIRTSCNTIPSSISSLLDLESLIIKGVKGEMDVPETIWDMVKLRRLHIDPRFRFGEASNNSSKLENLETLSTPCINIGEEDKLLRKVPNLHKLRCDSNVRNDPNSFKNSFRYPNLESLDKLESCKVLYYGTVKLSGKFKLPSNLKKLSISKFRLQWNQIAAFQNIEILKLCSGSVEGEFWDTGETEFSNLKVLKLKNLNIERWDASEENFPQLGKLVLERCKQLNEIPSRLGDIITLERIEVLWCRPSAAKSAKHIEEQRMGSGPLKVHIYPSTSSRLNK